LGTHVSRVSLALAKNHPTIVDTRPWYLRASVSRSLNFLHPRNSHSRGFLPDSDEADT